VFFATSWINMASRECPTCGKWYQSTASAASPRNPSSDGISFGEGAGRIDVSVVMAVCKRASDSLPQRAAELNGDRICLKPENSPAMSERSARHLSERQDTLPHRTSALYLQASGASVADCVQQGTPGLRQLS